LLLDLTPTTGRPFQGNEIRLSLVEEFNVASRAEYRQDPAFSSPGQPSSKETVEIFKFFSYLQTPFLELTPSEAHRKRKCTGVQLALAGNLLFRKGLRDAALMFRLEAPPEAKNQEDTSLTN
jgi:hypothetical protein